MYDDLGNNNMHAAEALRPYFEKACKFTSKKTKATIKRIKAKKPSNK